MADTHFDARVRITPNMKLSAVSAIVLGLAAAIGAGAVVAQQGGGVARLRNVEGGVLVSQGDAMAAAANDQRVPLGARVVTTAGGKVVVRYDNGCEVALKENQRFTVREGECAALIAEVLPVGPQPALAAAGVTVDSIMGGIAIGGFGLGAYWFFRDDSVSPN